MQNRRFVLLVERGAHPNLASRILGQMIRELPSLWHKRFGYEPLLAETYSAIYNLLRQLDVDEFAEQLSLWLQQHTGSLPAALALDGKFIRDTVGVVCLVDHETGVPRAMAKASKKEGEGKDCELKASPRLWRAGNRVLQRLFLFSELSLH